MEQIKLKAILRAQRGKQSAKRMRREGLIPAVVYHRGEEPVAISVADKEMNRILRTAGGENVLISLDIEKEKKARGRSVIIKEIQHDPVKRHVLHVDFNEISLTEKILVEVEVVGQGEPVGVKQDGGVLDHPLRTLKVQCLPTDIPKHIDVDVSGLKLNESIHVKDITVAGTLKVLTDPEAVLFLVKLHEEKVEETPAEPQEVEVLTEKKEEEAPAAGAAGAEKGKEEPKAAEKTVKPEKK
ncbi:MAG: 50S ribosomal protein L25 [Candidatus Omnitrophica bacterium]|nr:50S ribosomal protein L25 [Candidatus Omnitrophota bacterium]